MQALIATTRGGSVPHNHIVCAVGRRDPGRAAPVLTLAPTKRDRRRICRSNLIGPDRAGVVMKTNIRSLAGMVSDSRYPSVSSSHVRLVRGPGNTAEIIAVEQVSIAIFAQSEHKLRRSSSRHIDDRRADASEIGIAIIETEPIRRRPVVGRLTRPCRSRLQTDNGFTAHPVAACIEGVSCDDKHVCAIAGNAAVTPNTAAHGCCSPAMHIGRVVDVHADNPTMIIAAVAHVAGVGRVYDAVHQRESTALFLRQRNEWNSVVNDGGVQIHRPTRSGGAGVQVQRINEMFCGGAVDQCVEEKPTGGEIDNRSACDTSGKKTSARGVWDGRTNIGARPDREACRGIKRINVIRFCDGNDHRPVWAALDVKRLRVNVARDRAIEVEITREIRGRGGRKCRVNVNAVAGRIVMLLRDIDLRAGTRNDSQRENQTCDNENETRHMPEKDAPPRFLYNSMPFVCQGSTAAQPWSKSNVIVSFFRPAVAVNRYTFPQVAKLCASARYTA